jgi:hypothetical protein
MRGTASLRIHIVIIALLPVIVRAKETRLAVSDCFRQLSDLGFGDVLSGLKMMEI